MKGEKPSREFVVGKWGTNQGLWTGHRPAGRRHQRRRPFGNWTYTDGVIGFVDEPDFKVTVTVIDGSTMESTSESSGKSPEDDALPLSAHRRSPTAVEVGARAAVVRNIATQRRDGRGPPRWWITFASTMT